MNLLLHPMPLQIEFKGTKAEQNYMKKLITPFKDSAFAELKPHPRDFYLDILVLGAEEMEAFRRGKPNLERVPVILELFRTSPNTFLKYNNHGGFFEVPNEYIEKLAVSNNIDDKIVFSLTPGSKDYLVKYGIQPLSFHGDLSKATVYTADENSILFGYAIGDRHPADIPFMVKMFYNPKK